MKNNRPAGDRWNVHEHDRPVSRGRSPRIFMTTLPLDPALLPPRFGGDGHLVAPGLGRTVPRRTRDCLSCFWASETVSKLRIEKELCHDVPHPVPLPKGEGTRKAARHASLSLRERVGVRAEDMREFSHGATIPAYTGVLKQPPCCALSGLRFWQTR
jgi:hypothetical protein